MDIAGELLNKPEYFTCERFHCRLRIEVCIGRQKNNKLRRPLDPAPFEGCEKCPQGEEIMAANENTRICETEKCETTTINPKNPFCASCLAQKSNAAKAKKKDTMKSDSKTNGKDRAMPRKSIVVPISKPIQIDFGKHISLLDNIKELADEEMRPLEWQIIYMLKNHFKGIKEGTLQTR